MTSFDQRRHNDLRSRIGWAENRLQEIPQGMAIERASLEGELRKTKAKLEKMDIPKRWPQQIIGQFRQPEEANLITAAETAKLAHRLSKAVISVATPHKKLLEINLMEIRLTPRRSTKTWTYTITLEESIPDQQLTKEHTPLQTAYHNLCQAIDETLDGHTTDRQIRRFIDQVANNSQSIYLVLAQSGTIAASNRWPDREQIRAASEATR